LKRNSTRSPKKQRARLMRSPLHKKKKNVSAPLSEDLRKRYKIRKLPVRREDIVHIRIGTFRGTEGRITRVNLQKQILEIDGITREKMDGSKIFYPIHPSNVVIVRLGRLDASRKSMIERKAKEKVEFPEEKEPIEEITEIAEKELEEDEDIELDTEDLRELEEDIVRSPLTVPDEEE